MESPIHFNLFATPSSQKQAGGSMHCAKRGLTATSPTLRSKRKRSSDDMDTDNTTPSLPYSLPAHASSPGNKRTRTLPVGRLLPLPRLLDTLDRDGMRQLLTHLCERHPGLTQEVTRHLARPGVHAALQTLSVLERQVQLAFPFGGDVKGEYAYNRVLPSITALLEALADYVPSFLPPCEPQALDTLAFLDGATGIIARLPEWHNGNHMLAKQQAFEEIGSAWRVAFAEAGKRGGGIAALGYLQKLREWDAVSGGRLTESVEAAMQSLAWTVGLFSN